MKLIMYILLGIIQGFTEPIPISSSGHLVLFNRLFNIEKLNDLNFEIFSNFGSFIAITYFYKDEIINIIKDFLTYIKTKEERFYNNYKYVLMIIIGTIPAGLLGLLFKDKIESINNIKILGIALLITSLMLFIIKNKKGIKDKKDITFIDSFIIGLFQTIALFPGISRSGSTLFCGMIRNLKRETAFKFSFMLYIPISIATMILGIKDVIRSNINSNILILYIIGTLTSCIVTYFSINWFKSIVEKGNLKYFIYYCLIVGILIILFL